MANVFSTNKVSQAGLALIAQATSSNPIAFVKALSSATVPSDPDDDGAYTGIEGAIDASSATESTARVIARFGNASTSSQLVKAIAIMAKLASQSDSDAVVFAYSSDADSQIYFPSRTAPAQRTRFAFAFDFSQTQSVSVTEAGCATLADLERFVSCHRAGNPNVGDAQTILGDKTWEGRQNFHDTISTHNIYPSETATYDLGSDEAEYDHVYAQYGTFSTNMQARNIKAWSGLDIKSVSMLGKTRMESDYYTYELQIHGGDKYATPQTGVCGRLDILPTITVYDASSGSADYTAEVRMGTADHRISEINAVRVNQKFCMIQPVDGTLADATTLYTEKVLEPGGDRPTYDYAIYIQTPERPLGQIWNYAIVPDRNLVDLGYSSQPFCNLYLESGFVLGSKTDNNGGIKLSVERTNAATQGHYDLNLDIWMACGSNTLTWDNFNIVPWTGSIAQKINLGTEDRPFNNIDVSGNIRCVDKRTGQYMTGTLGDISHYWWNTYTAYVSVKNCLSSYEITGVSDPTTATSSNKASVSDLTAGETGGGILLLSKVGSRNTKYHVDNVELGKLSVGSLPDPVPDVYEGKLTKVPVGGLVLAVPTVYWAQNDGSGRSINPGASITVSGDVNNQWRAAEWTPSGYKGKALTDTNQYSYLEPGTYRTLSYIKTSGTEQSLGNHPVLLQRIA